MPVLWLILHSYCLFFFLVTTTMDVDSGIARKLPPMPEENVEIPEIHKRNIFVVLINKNNKICSWDWFSNKCNRN